MIDVWLWIGQRISLMFFRDALLTFYRYLASYASTNCFYLRYCSLNVSSSRNFYLLLTILSLIWLKRTPFLVSYSCWLMLIRALVPSMIDLEMRDYLLPSRFSNTCSIDDILKTLCARSTSSFVVIIFELGDADIISDDRRFLRFDSMNEFFNLFVDDFGNFNFTALFALLSV